MKARQGSKNLSESRAPTKGSEKMDDLSCISCSFPGYFEPSADTLLMPGLNQNLSDSRAPTKGSEKVDDSNEQQELAGNSGERSGNSCSMSGNEDEEGSKIADRTYPIPKLSCHGIIKRAFFLSLYETKKNTTHTHTHTSGKKA